MENIILHYCCPWTHSCLEDAVFLIYVLDQMSSHFCVLPVTFRTFTELTLALKLSSYQLDFSELLMSNSTDLTRK